MIYVSMKFTCFGIVYFDKILVENVQICIVKLLNAGNPKWWKLLRRNFFPLEDI